MKDKGRVALARIVFANREHILSVEPWDKGMLATTLRYDYEVREEAGGAGKQRICSELIGFNLDVAAA
jgi:non-homologous end joining protein Ku